MRAKEYLQQAYYLDKRISGDLEELARLKELSTSITPGKLSGERVKGGKQSHDKVGEIIAKIDIPQEGILKPTPTPMALIKLYHHKKIA